MSCADRVVVVFSFVVGPSELWNDAGPCRSTLPGQVIRSRRSSCVRPFPCTGLADSFHVDRGAWKCSPYKPVAGESESYVVIFFWTSIEVPGWYPTSP